MIPRKDYFIIIKYSNVKEQKENINNLIIFINNLLNNYYYFHEEI